MIVKFLDTLKEKEIIQNNVVFGINNFQDKNKANKNIFNKVKQNILGIIPKILGSSS
jgi:hypothetical protein